MVDDTIRPAGRNGAHAEKAAAPESSELTKLLLRAASDLGATMDDFRILGSVRSDRLRLRLRGALEDAQRAVAWSLATTALVLAGVIVLAIGAKRGLEVLFEDRPWAGEIAAGLLMILVAVVLSTARRASARRKLVRNLEKQYEEMESRSPPKTEAS